MINKNVPRWRFKDFKDEWKLNKLGNICNINMGQSPHSKNYTSDSNQYILVQGNADLFNGTVKPRIYTTEITRTANKNDIIMTVRAPVGELAINQFNKVVIGRGVASIKGNEFIYNALKKVGMDNMWNRLSAGSTFKAVNSDDIKLLNVKLPSLPEQQRIGNFFSKLDHLIDLHSQKLEQLKKLKRGYLQKMFPQKCETVPRIRFSGFSGEWKEVKFGDICKVKMGQSPHSKNYTTDSNENILVQGNADLSNGQVMPRLYTTEETKTSDKDDIIMTVRAPVGELAINQFNKVVIGRGVASIKGNEFIYNALKKIDMDHTWDRVSSGSTFQAVNSEDIKSLNIKIPTILEQQKLGELFKILDNGIELCKEKITKLEKQKKAYLQKMFI